MFAIQITSNHIIVQDCEGVNFPKICFKKIFPFVNSNKKLKKKNNLLVLVLNLNRP